MKDVVLDTETTGLSIEDGHRIVEIGCIELENFVPTKNIFHCYLNPERKVSENAFKIHGYSDKFLSDKKKFADIAEEFLEFIKGKKIIIHNAEFDIGHINNELGLLNKNKLKMENVIDTLDLARSKFPGSSTSLDALCKRFRIDNSKRKNHTALIDCDLLSKVYINLLDQKEPTLDFADKKADLVFNYNNKQIKYSKKIVEVTKEESTAHSIFLKEKLKKNFFN
tara:strand:+ start:33 stop:704 length:672 start_codon:yes stop_codon:yes gene_type:complete